MSRTCLDVFKTWREVIDKSLDVFLNNSSHVHNMSGKCLEVSIIYLDMSISYLEQVFVCLEYVCNMYECFLIHIKLPCLCVYYVSIGLENVWNISRYA